MVSLMTQLGAGAAGGDASGTFVSCHDERDLDAMRFNRV